MPTRKTERNILSWMIIDLAKRQKLIEKLPEQFEKHAKNCKIKYIEEEKQ